MDEIPSYARIREDLARATNLDATVEIVASLCHESYALGVVDGSALGREEERAQLKLPLDAEPLYGEAKYVWGKAEVQARLAIDKIDLAVDKIDGHDDASATARAVLSALADDFKRLAEGR